MVIGCVSGELLVLEALELKAVLHTEGGGAADALLPWSKGFLVGQSNGMVAVFERDDRDSFQRSRVLRFKEPKRISTLSMSAGEGQLAVATPPGHLYTLQFRNLEILKLEEDNFEALAGMDLPGGPLTGLDVCLRKPLVATTSLDKAVRIWNWNDAALEMCKHFQDEAYSIAMHPNGMLVAVGFADKLRLMAVLMDDLKARSPGSPVPVSGHSPTGHGLLQAARDRDARSAFVWACSTCYCPRRSLCRAWRHSVLSARMTCM